MRGSRVRVSRAVDPPYPYIEKLAECVHMNVVSKVRLYEVKYPSTWVCAVSRHKVSQDTLSFSKTTYGKVKEHTHDTQDSVGLHTTHTTHAPAYGG